ncbi:PTS-dependent dihydroxyacetone kinase phosphotransferase subunit DhaM [Caviibacter abscessus]|uniref:PTS-dependent dihydroxyacetone kinase phosphotransferase subunit DhaM n=1 Tax=Caviibacter abscessus TaxID=1766719 RepID=UPI00083902DF|nr:diguanylate cyclase [Caviibacter abscessus]
MVGIVIVCHSNKMVENFIEFLDMFKTNDFNILNGADSSKDFGTSVPYLVDAIKKADSGQGVLVFVDLGSSIDYALNAKKMLKGEIDVEIADCPVVEGCISAVAANDVDIDLQTLKEIAQDSINFKKVKNE